MSKKSLLASFGVRSLEILRAVVSGNFLYPATIDGLVSIGWASVLEDGTVALTIAGQAAHALLEKLDAIPEEHVDLLESLSGTIPEQEPVVTGADKPASRHNPFGSP